MVVEVMPQFLDVYCITELMCSGEITLVKHPWTSLRADSPRDWGYPSPSEVFEGIRSVSKKLAKLFDLMYLLGSARKVIMPES